MSSAAVDERPARELAAALVRWQRAAGPFWPYVCAAPFIQPLPTRAGARRRLLPGLAQTLTAASATKHAALFLDLPPVQTLPMTPLLNRLGYLVVPIIQRWVAAPAVLRCERLLGLLIEYGRQVERPAAPCGVALLLDGERAGVRAAPIRPLPDPRAFDNRYTYRLDRFPQASFLQREAVRSVHWIVPAGLAADLQPYARQLQAAGLPNQVIALSGQSPPPVRSGEWSP